MISPSPSLYFNRSKNVSSISSNYNRYKNAISDVGVVGSGGYEEEPQKKTKNANWIAVAILQGAFSFDDLLSSANHDNSILLLDYCHKDSKNSKNYHVRCSANSYPSVGGSADNKEQFFSYPKVLGDFDFCLVIRDLASPVLWEVMSAGCIPVIIADHHRLPFDEVVDWRSNSVQLYEHQLHQLSSILSSITQSRRARLKAQVKFTFETYFKNMNKISESLIITLKDRVFTHYVRSIQEWNQRAQNFEDQQKISGPSQTSSVSIQSPLFNPVTAPKDAGFTAVILAYERVTSLFSVIQRVSQVPSLAKILVIWNNQLKEPPSCKCFIYLNALYLIILYLYLKLCRKIISCLFYF